MIKKNLFKIAFVFTLIFSNSSYCSHYSNEYLENAFKYAQQMEQYNREKEEDKYKQECINKNALNPKDTFAVYQAKRDAKVTMGIWQDIHKIRRDGHVDANWYKLWAFERLINNEVNHGHFEMSFEDKTRKIWQDLHDKEKIFYQNEWRKFHKC